METGEACRILGLEGLDAAMDRARLQKAFHRRLFQIHPDMQASPSHRDRTDSTQGSATESTADHAPIDSQSASSVGAEDSPPTGKFQGSEQAGTVVGSDRLDSGLVTVDSLIEARKTLLLRLESRDWPANESATGVAESVTNESFEGSKQTSAAASASASAEEPWGKDGYNLYRRALFLYSEGILAYFERKKRMQGEDASSAAETRAFREGLEEARGLFVQVLERFPGGIWTPDSIEQIARINIWLKSNGSRGG